MTELKNVYLIDRLENVGKYVALGANMKTACEFLAKGDFSILAAGRNTIDGDRVFVNNVVADYVAKTERRPEVHHRYFDIHVPLEADECLGLAVFDPNAKGSFDEAGDGGLYEQPVEWFTVKKGEFAICWPVVCAHAPAVTTDTPKKAHKLIVKILA